jgi:flavodoxin
MNEQIDWEQIEERAKRKEQQIQRLHYSKERQVIKASIFNQAQEWARLQAELGLPDDEIEKLIKKWLKKLYHEYKLWDMEFDNLYFQNIQEKKKSRN